MVPACAGCPVPRNGALEDNAQIMMAYFHPWTLRANDADEHAPFAGGLKGEEASWSEGLRTWLDGHVISEEAQKYISNFMNVYRVRPTDGEDDLDARSDDVISDEELEVSHADLDIMLTSRIGGKQQDADSCDMENVEDRNHFRNSLMGMAIAKEAWPVMQPVASRKRRKRLKC